MTGLGLRGALAVALGLATAGAQILAVLMPVVTASVLVLLFGAYAALDGVLALIWSFRSGRPHDAWLRLQGVLGVGAGGALLAGMVAAAAPVLYLIACWALAMGVIELLAARRLARGVRTLATAAAVTSLVFGAAVLVGWPGAGLLLFMWLLAAYALVLGALRIVAALR